MSRTKDGIMSLPETPEILPAAEQAIALAQAATFEADTRVKSLASSLSYEGSLLPDALENGARDAIRRINVGLFELGGYLLLLRETCDHGEFLQRLGRLELEPRVAQQYMQVTKRFANANLNSHLGSLGKTKLLEMLVLDKEQIDELKLTGQIGELSLDDIATMSVKELRAALRESRAEHDATKAVMSKKQDRIDQLERAQERIAKMPPDEELQKLQQEATTHLLAAQGAIRGQLRAALIALQNHTDDNGTFMAGMVGQLMADLTGLRDEFNLPSLTDGAQPEWQRWAAVQGAGAGAAQAN